MAAADLDAAAAAQDALNTTLTARDARIAALEQELATSELALQSLASESEARLEAERAAHAARLAEQADASTVAHAAAVQEWTARLDVLRD